MTQKKFNLIAVFFISLGCFSLTPQLVRSAYVCYPGCDAYTCVNDSCSLSGTYGWFKNATAGDEISLIHSDLKLAKKITVEGTPIDNWSIESGTGSSQILKFFLPSNIKTGVAFIYVYDSDGALIANGALTIYSKSTLSPPQPVVPITSPPVYQPPQLQQPSCTADMWSCGDWNPCSLSGVQNRSCRKTFDCPSVETAPPVADQYCEAPNKPTQQVPQDSNEISNQDTIIKATVKLICPLDANRASQGSGTVIDPSGIILTNQHVVEGTLGCLVGFINDFNDEPYFGDRQIADIQKVSSNEDVAILKLRNPQNKELTYINIANSNNNFRLGTKVNIYGYPAKFGTNITYTSGDFSGTSGSYLKTTAIIEHGNSGGGAYFNDGKFIGVPSAVIKGELNALGYILSINTINAWLGDSSIVYNSSNNQNNYSRVSSVLENIDLKKLNSMELVITGTKENKEVNSRTTQDTPAVPQNQIQKETSNTNAEPQTQNQQEMNSNDNPTPIQSAPQPRLSLARRFINWITSWFK